MRIQRQLQECEGSEAAQRLKAQQDALWDMEDLMEIEQTQFDALSKKAVKIIGQDVIGRMSDAQLGLLNKELDRTLQRRRGNVDAVTRGAGLS